MRISVVLPAPFSPSNAWMLPVSSSNETSSSTTDREKVFVMCDIRSSWLREASMSESGRRIDEGGRRAEASRDRVSERAYAQRFGGVVTSVKHDDPVLARLHRRVM